MSLGLSGAEIWNETEGYGKVKQAWYKVFLTLPGGIPSDDTFNRVISVLDPAKLENGFVAWVYSIVQLTAGEVVAIDDKALRGTRETGKATFVYMVSAWASANNPALAQHKVDAKSNEIMAISKLLAALELSGTVVTLDRWAVSRRLPRRSSAKKLTIFWRSRRIRAVFWRRSRTPFRCWPPMPCKQKSIALTGASNGGVGDHRAESDREGSGVGVFTGADTYLK